ncbi:MAG TPA: hypothetical protein VIN09_07375 [Chloroflexota bacterium]
MAAYPNVDLEQMRALVSEQLAKLPKVLNTPIPREAIEPVEGEPLEERVRRFARLAPAFSITPTELVCLLRIHNDEMIPQVRAVLDRLVAEGVVTRREAPHEPVYAKGAA